MCKSVHVALEYHTFNSFLQVKLIGEGADDAGGVFDDTITEMCQELKTGVVNLILTTPNARNETGYNRDRYKISTATSLPTASEGWG